MVAGAPARPAEASTGSVRVANQAGAAPKTMPVTSARPKAKASTIGEGRVLMGRNCDVGERQREQQARGAGRTSSPATPPATASSTLSTSACSTICAPRGADSQAHRCLRATRDRAREQQVRHVRARDEQHEPADGEQDLQAPPVLFLHHADTGAGRARRRSSAWAACGSRRASSWRGIRSRVRIHWRRTP